MQCTAARRRPLPHATEIAEASHQARHRAGAPAPVALVAFPEFQMLDIAGPADVFAMANAFHVEPAYRVTVVSAAGGPLAASTASRCIPSRSRPCRRAASTPARSPAAARWLVASVADHALADWVRQASRHARRYGSVCTGAFALAHWGLLDAHRATTHWASAHLLQRYYGGVDVQAEALYVQDGKVWTSGG